MRPSNMSNTENDGPFVRKRKFIENQKMQMALAPITLDHLRNFGVSDDEKLKIEFFFYSRSPIKAESLARELRNLKYEVETGKSAGNKNLFIITGWTTKMKMDDKTMQHWTEDMCELGYKFDCEFDGWGTMPDQDW